MYAAKRDPSCPPVAMRSIEDCIIIPNFRRDARIIYRLLAQKYGHPVQECELRPTIYVRKYAMELGLSESTKKTAERICVDVAKSRCCQGRNPLCVAAAILYIASYLNNQRIQQRVVAI